MSVTVEGSYDKELSRLDVVPQDLGRVFMNLLNNAFEAMHDRFLKGDAAYEPKVFLSTSGKEAYVEIRFVDNGIGVAASIRDKIFNPFFTTREVGDGAGLGLSMSYEIVAAHGGSIEYEEGDEEGAAFVIRLPH
jgi:signal transduction histidine kinase